MNHATADVGDAGTTANLPTGEPKLDALRMSLRAIIASERFRIALQTALAMVLAYGVSLAMDWPKPVWAGLAIAMCSLGTTGESMQKGVQRVLGTLLAVPVALLIVSLFAQDRWGAFIALALWTGGCAYLSGPGRCSYFWFVAGFTVPLLSLFGNQEPVSTFGIVLMRAQETMLGVVSLTLVSLLVLPVSSTRSLRDTATETAAALRKMAASTFSALSSPTSSAKRSTARDELGALRARASAPLTALSGKLDAAAADTYEVWETRHHWRAVEHALRDLDRALSQLGLGLVELADVDVPRFIQGLDSLADAVDARLSHIQTRFSENGKAVPIKVGDIIAEPIPLRLSDASRALSHLEQAALALCVKQLRRIDQLSAALSAHVDAIFGSPSPAERRRLSIDAQPGDQSRSMRSRLPTLDPERLRGLVRQQSSFWLAILAWIYVPDIPLSNVVIVLAASVSTLLVNMPWLSLQRLIPPLVIALTAAGLIGLLVMPQLAGFALLALLLFAVVFLISWVFHLPKQVLARSIGLTAFVLVINVSNQQTYNFVYVANLALGVPLAVALLVLTTYLPLSFRAEDRFRAILRRRLSSAAWLLGTLGTDDERAARARSPLFRRRLQRHRTILETYPGLLATWGGSLPAKSLGKTDPEAIGALVTALRASA